MRISFIVAIVCFLLTGCVSKLEIESGENAIGCFRAGGSTAAPALAGSTAGVEVEVSDNVDVSNWTADDWVKLIEACPFGI